MLENNPFKQRQTEKNRIQSGKDEILKKKEIADLEKTYELEDTKEKFDYAAKTLADYNGLESNIPINHPYWRIRP